MKNVKEKIKIFRPILSSLLESKTQVSISRMLEIKELIAEAETVLKAEFSLDIRMEVLTLKLSLKTLRNEHFNPKQLQEKLKENLLKSEKACYQKQPMQNFAEEIQYLENFIDAINFGIEELDSCAKALCEMDILMLEIYIDYLKNKFPALLKKAEIEVKVSKSSAAELVENFLDSLKLNSEQDSKELTDDLNKDLKKICGYLHTNPQLFSKLEIGQSAYISKDTTHLKFTLQIKNTDNGFELYVGLKTKLEDWVRSGSYKKVKKNLMLINGEWHKGVDAVVVGEKDSNSKYDKIKLALAESEFVQNLDPLYVHKITPAAAYSHKGEYKHSFVSSLAEGCLDDVIYESTVMSRISIEEVFLLCYSMAASLAYIHSPKVNLVHKDVKGDNFLIFVDSDDVVWAKLADFGLAKYSINEKEQISDIRPMMVTWQALLKHYAHYRDSVSSKNEVYEDLLLFCENILEAPPENPPTDAMVLEGLNLILEKMQVSQPSEAAWIKEKIEKHYSTKLNSPSMQGVEMDCLQRFFPKSTKKPIPDYNPEKVYRSDYS